MRTKLEITKRLFDSMNMVWNIFCMPLNVSTDYFYEVNCFHFLFVFRLKEVLLYFIRCMRGLSVALFQTHFICCQSVVPL